MRKTILAGACALALAATAAAAQGPPREGATNSFVRIGQGVNAVVWRPAGAPAKPGVVLINMHDESSSLDGPIGPNMARRGYLTIAANPRTVPDAQDRDTDWDADLADVGAVVRYARSLPGTTKVVLIGHSSGAPLMSAYQAIAENGVAFCRGPARLSQCPDSLANLPRADGLMLLDPIFGVGANVLTSVDPAVRDERRPRALDARLDAFDPANGFAATGAHYPDGFKAAYFAAEARRNNALIEGALAAARRVAAGQGQFADDEPFLAPGANRRPRIWQPDLGMLAHTKGAYPVIHADGRTTTEIARSVRVPSGTTNTTPVLNGGSLDTSVKRFLSTFATRALPGYRVTEDSIEGVDWASSYTNTPSNVEGVTVPFLVMGMTGHYWLVSTEMAYLRVRSVDKSIAFVEGATHGFSPCVACAKTPGQWGDTTAHTFDYIAAWLAPRF